MRNDRPSAIARPLAALAIAAVPLCASAQRAPLSLAEARAQAAATHPALAAASADAEAAVGRARQVLLLDPPELELELGTEGVFDGPEVGVTYLTPLRSRGKTRIVDELVTLDARLARLAVERARAALGVEVTRTFLRAAALAERVRLGLEDSATVAALVANARRRRVLGLATDLDVLRLEAEESAARRRLMADRGAHAGALEQLAALLGRDIPGDQPLAFDQAALAADTTALALARLGGELATAAAQAEVERARPALALARRSRWTDPRIGGAYEYQLGEHTLSAVVRVPLPARAGNRFAIRAAESELRAAEFRLADARRRAAAARRRILAERGAATAQLELLRDDLRRRRVAEALARRRLEQGGPYLQIWLDIRRGRIALEREELDLLLTLATARLARPADDEEKSMPESARWADSEMP